MYNHNNQNIMNIIGRLTRDAEISTLSNNKQVVNFSIAVNDSYRNKQGERVQLTEYVRCAYWLSTRVADILTKGTLVELAGRVSARAWVDGNGEAHAALNFHTSEIKLHGGGRKADPAERRSHNASGVAADTSNTTASTDDLPF